MGVDVKCILLCITTFRLLLRTKHAKQHQTVIRHICMYCEQHSQVKCKTYAKCQSVCYIYLYTCTHTLTYPTVGQCCSYLPTLEQNQMFNVTIMFIYTVAVWNSEM
jgi:hypothetical protein